MGLLMKQIKNMLHIRPDISVIMPFYNSEKYILRALNSIENQTDIRIELICVDDGSTDNSAMIVKKHIEEHPWVRLVSHDVNKGLYLARLTGVKNAKGKYIGFLDSDDYVSPCYFEKLCTSAKKEKADIAVGEVVNVNSENVSYIQTRCKVFPFLNEDDPYVHKVYSSENNSLMTEEIYSSYWAQRGRCYHWHVVWNKIYRDSIIKKCIKELSEQNSHLVMLEDFIFSSIVLSRVKSYSQAENAYYYYCENPISSIVQKDYSSVKKNIEDMQNAFDFIEAFLKKSFLNRYQEDFLEWKSRYGRYWKRNVNNMSFDEADKRKLELMLESYFGDNILSVTEEDEYYYEKAELL